MNRTNLNEMASDRYEEEKNTQNTIIHAKSETNFA